MKILSNYRNIIKFLIGLLIVSIVFGSIYYLLQSSDIKSIIVNSLENIGDYSPKFNIVFHLTILSLILILTISIIGIPLIIFYLFYEGFSLGFLFTGIINYLGLKGLLNGFIFIFFNKFIYIACLIYLLYLSINYFFQIKHRLSKDIIMSKYLKRFIIVFIIIVINDIIIYFLTPKILSLFIF